MEDKQRMLEKCSHMALKHADAESELDDCPKCSSQCKDLVIHFFNFLDTDRDKIHLLIDHTTTTLNFMDQEYHGLPYIMSFYINLPRSEHVLKNIEAERLREYKEKECIGYSVNVRGTITFDGDIGTEKWFQQKFIILEINEKFKILEMEFQYLEIEFQHLEE
ncbi:uncharacterized protein LOC119662157 [Teleopsis dalmanni]|uniref:uncharacterized protein LOC119662157 n=1 Tax=Teleopsis dalmanni TaxID=139649 RepID=UPI0018CC8982|nr:uncharacterized protein LOC119662157 [Teleopsis dalmanni]